MSHSPLVFDGLRRALCPGVSRASCLALAWSSSAYLQRGALSERSIKPRRRLAEQQSRCYALQRSIDLQEPFQEPPSVFSTSANPEVPPTTPTSSPAVSQLLEAEPPSAQDLEQTSTEDIQEAMLLLRRSITSEAEFDMLERLVRLATFLARHRDMHQSMFIYESLVEGMAHPRGSAHSIMQLYNDVHKSGLVWSETFCRAALRSLAVHPNYQLQLEILDAMREQWYVVETSDLQNVILGLLRDEQYELAYERFNGLLETGNVLDLWLYDILITVFLKLRFHYEAVKCFEARGEKENQDAGYANLVYEVLDRCSSDYYYEGTAMAWDIAVQNELFNPPDGMLDNIMCTALYRRDSLLAVTVYQKLSSRTRVTRDHCKLLVEAFTESGDILGALRTLAILDEVGIAEEEVEVVNRRLRTSEEPGILEDAEKIVRELATAGKGAASPMRALILAVARQKGGEEAFKLIEEMPSLCGEHASDRCWRAAITYAVDLEQRRIIAQRYREVFPEGPVDHPHTWSYPRLIDACVECGDLDLAMQFALNLAEVLDRPVKFNIRWFYPLVKAALEAEDKRIWDVYDAMQSKGDPDAALSCTRMLVRAGVKEHNGVPLDVESELEQKPRQKPKREPKREFKQEQREILPGANEKLAEFEQQLKKQRLEG